ncbi:hypothetical protein TNCV_297651 [Trichonephila clavipes]|nr:hypothetical protein TNCV_297651 [Trichonephila clavipes]
MLDFTRKGCHKIVSSMLLPLFELPDPQICLQSSISGIIWEFPVGHSTSLDELEVRLQQIRNKIPQDIIHNFYASVQVSQDYNSKSCRQRVTPETGDCLKEIL